MYAATPLNGCSTMLYTLRREVYIGILILSSFFCALATPSLAAQTKKTPSPKGKSSTSSKKNNIVKKNPKVLVTTREGLFTIELYLKDSPVTANHFLKSVRSGSYNRTYFSRYISDFILVGGTSLKKTKKIKQNLELELSPNLFHERGIVGAIRRRLPSRNAQEFYICLSKQPSLDGKYTIFGRVIKGMEVVDTLKVNSKIIKIELVRKKVKRKKKKKTRSKSRRKSKRKRRKKSR